MKVKESSSSVQCAPLDKHPGCWSACVYVLFSLTSVIANDQTSEASLNFIVCSDSIAVHRNGKVPALLWMVVAVLEVRNVQMSAKKLTYKLPSVKMHLIRGRR